MSRNGLSQRKSEPTRLVIVDDHELTRAGLRSMLSGQRRLKVVGEASNGQEALALCRRLQPDLALLDIRMPEMDGLQTCRALKQECPATSVILITIHSNPDYLLEAIKAGAAGYLLKDLTQSELLSAIQRVLRGESILEGQLMTRLLRRLANETSSQADMLAVPLSQREREVVQLLAEGLTNREIADTLTVSVGTVKAHVEHILTKLGVSDRTQAAVRVVELGLYRSTSK
jgi:DNA-binding NarL/FixJ family response regulator